jgi:hypothetical protein
MPSGEFMSKTLICILLGVAIIVVVPIATVYGEDIDTKTHKIVIKTGDDVISVKEDLTIGDKSNQTYDAIKFWIPEGADSINILFNNNEAQSIDPVGNEYTCNISNLDIKMNESLTVTISYTLSKDVEEFEKTLPRNTTSITVEFDKNKIYTGENLTTGASFTLQLYKPTETPLSWYIIVFIVLLVILLIVSTLYSFKKQRSLKIKDITGESEELLNTKKMLLMSLLKDIEKQHRSKKISDDTYHKLRGQYKQQAVETMKKLEDVKSKIK